MRIINIFNQKQYIFGLGLIILDLITLILYIDFSPRILCKYFFYLNLSIIIFYFLLCVFLESEFVSSFLKILQIKLEKLLPFFSLLIISCVPFNYFFGVIFLADYLYYETFCPYTFSGIDYKLHLERRCELYNINKENFYPFQYICSYNETKIDIISKKVPDQFETGPFPKKKCSKVESLINNNKVIDEFVNEYYKENLYYCDLEKQIQKFNITISPKNCEIFVFSLPIFIPYTILGFLFLYFVPTYFKNIRANVISFPDYSHLKMN